MIESREISVGVVGISVYKSCRERPEYCSFY